MVTTYNEYKFKNDFFPFKISWMLTTNCNFNCNYCFLPYSFRKRCYREVDIGKVLKRLREWGVFGLELIGGEPLLRKERLEKIIKITARKPPFVTRISSNGMLYNQDIAKELQKSRYFKQMQISLDAASENTYKEIRGSGKFFLVIENVKKYIDSKIPVSLSMVLNRKNYHEIDDFVNLGEKLGVSSVSFDGLMCNFSNQSFHDAHLNYLDMFNLKEKLENLTSDKIEIKLNNSHLNNGLCAAGLLEFTMLPNGDLYPCAVCVENKNLKIGNVFTGIDKNRTEELKGFIHYKLPQVCLNCKIPSICDGACKFTQIALGKSFFSDRVGCHEINS